MRLGKLSMLLSLLLMISITAGLGEIPRVFGQNAFVNNITASDIIDLVDNTTEGVVDQVKERAREELDDKINLTIFSDTENSNINYSIDDNRRRTGVDISSSSSPSLITALSTPTPFTVMINEVELNPKGEDDDGEEWIELYNPSDVDINIGNFEIRTSSASATIKLPTDAIVEPGETYVFEFEEGQHHLSNIVESLILVDATTGNDDIILDRTPSLVDMSNDERTWQRIPDGNNEWRFIEETQGELNESDGPTNNSDIVAKTYDTEKYYSRSEAAAECLGSAACIEGITTRIVNGDTLYVTANNNGTTYKVDLALVEASSSIEEGLVDSTAFTQDLCLGSKTLIDQDDKLLTSLVDSRIIAVVYCSSSNLNSELLDNGYAELDLQECARSEFANESWAKDHGC